MRMMTSFRAIGAAFAAVTWSAAVSAVPISAVDLNDVDLGVPIIGPLGPVVPGTFGDLGTLNSSVFCTPARLTCPVLDGEETYTYVHELTPSAPGFSVFTTPSLGFSGAAGFDFSEAEAAGLEFAIEELEDGGGLAWEVTNGIWDSDATVTFFWQTDRRPSGPTGEYTALTADGSLALSIGPDPIVVMSGPSPVPEPGLLLLVALGMVASGGRRFLSPISSRKGRPARSL